MTSETKDWVEITYGARWPSAKEPERSQIYEMICPGCKFAIDPGQFRRYDERRADHPQPYGNLASISHARKLMRVHAESHVAELEVEGE